MPRRVASYSRRRFAAPLAFIAAGILASAGAFPPAADAANSGGEQEVYRLYNTISKEHLYSTDANERDVLAQGDWIYEGVGWVAPQKSNVPVHRLYNPALGDHHYTRDMNEVRVLTARYGWRDEGTKWYSSESRDVAVMRLFHPGLRVGSHHFTTDMNEYSVLGGAGWRQEGQAWFALRQGTQALLPIDEDSSYASIEARVKASGNGAGYHAKLVMAGQSTANSYGGLVSFGLQRDNGSYCGSAMNNQQVLFVEGIMSDAATAGPRGKTYQCLQSTVPGRIYKLRMSYTPNNRQMHFYMNDVEVGKIATSANFRPSFAFLVEGSTKRRGDTIDAQFSGITIKAGDSANTWGSWGPWDDSFDYFGLEATAKPYTAVENVGTPSMQFTTNGWATAGQSVTISGTANIDSRANWDTSFTYREPRTGRTGLPLSAWASIAQRGRY